MDKAGKMPWPAGIPMVDYTGWRVSIYRRLKEPSVDSYDSRKHSIEYHTFARTVKPIKKPRFFKVQKNSCSAIADFWKAGSQDMMFVSAYASVNRTPEQVFPYPSPFFYSTFVLFSFIVFTSSLVTSP